MPTQSIQATFPENFNPKSLIFEQIQKRKIPSDKPDDKESAGSFYYQTNIKMRYADGTEGPVIFQLPRCPTYGVNLGMNSDSSVNKLSLSLVLGERDNYSDEYKRTVKALNDFVLACKQYIISTPEVKVAIGQEDIEMRDITGGKKEISPLRPHKEKDGKVISMDVRPPTLYPKMKVRTDKESGVKVIDSKFYEEGKFDAQGRAVEVDPRDFIGKAGHCTALVLFESIYFGTKIKIQCKVFECDIKARDNVFKSLIARTNAPATPLQATSYDEDAEEEVQEPEEEEEEASAPAILPEEEEATVSDDGDVEMAEPEAKRPPTPPPVVAAPTKTVRRGPAKK